jgi:hypothetical protein
VEGVDMKKELMLQDAGIKVVADRQWNVFAGNILLTYRFDVKQGAGGIGG